MTATSPLDARAAAPPDQPARRLRVIALVGIDGAGKTTQADWLAAWLTSAGIPATYYLNAGGRRWFGRLAQRLGRRDAEDLLGRRGLVLVETALRWLAIARALLLSRLRGSVAVMDRYAYCQYAAIRARNGRYERLARFLFATFPAPDHTFLLTLPPTQALTRIERRGTDTEELDYLERLDAAYRALPEAGRSTLVDASVDAQSVQRLLRERIAS